MAQRPANIIKSLEQGVFPKAVNVEMNFAPIGCGDGLSGKVNVQFVAFGGLHCCEEFTHDGGIQCDGQDTVIEAVVIEDVCETRGDEATKTIIVDSPGGVF